MQTDPESIAAFKDTLREAANLSKPREVLSDGYVIRVYGAAVDDFVDLGVYRHSSERGQVSVLIVYYGGKSTLAAYSGTPVETWVTNHVVAADR